MPVPALLAALLAVAATPSAPVRPVPPADPDAAAWVTVVAYDEVRVDVDSAHVGGAGPVSAWVRWTFADRAVSPTAWDLGVRSTVDAVEVDCRAFASRTLGSAAYAGDGAPVDAATFADDRAAWRPHAAGSVGGRVAAAVCRIAARP